MRIIEYIFELPKREVEQDRDKYIYKAFFQSIIKCLSDNNAIYKEKEEVFWNGELLFGYQDELYCLSDNFQINSSTRDYLATGSGKYHALASLHATQSLKIDTKERLTTAIQSADEFVISVDNKIDYVELEKPLTQEK